jgi:hypothetical protein
VQAATYEWTRYTSEVALFRSTIIFFFLYRDRLATSKASPWRAWLRALNLHPPQEQGYNQSLHVRSTGPRRFCSPALVALRRLVFLNAGHGVPVVGGGMPGGWAMGLSSQPLNRASPGS